MSERPKEGLVSAAFFDVDKTLIPGSSLFLLARGMYARDFIRVRDIVRFGWGQAAFRLLGREGDRGIEQSKSSTLEFVTGRHQDELRAWGREIVDERVLPRVYEDVSRIIESHKIAGDQTYLVTATPIELADYLAEALGMTGALGTESEIDDQGRYTGQLVGDILHGESKSKAVAQLASERGIDLDSSSAYSDSHNDLPLLGSVGHPHAVNPDATLRRIARTRGWPIHELRTRRRALLIGIPSALGGAAVFGLGAATGAAIMKRKRNS
ncbi:MAG TPA: HAD-IB family hydrolase [Actinomycetota bacterium]|nr:HAD-IB family hydrolase [Actinomycetota bacterium]